MTSHYKNHNSLKKVKHCKVKDTLLELRSEFWLPQGRRNVKRVLRKCFIGNKVESKKFTELPVPPLLSFRVISEHAFSCTGVDYLGPLMVKNIYGSDRELCKVHVVLYTCATSRAVHLDLVPDSSCLSFVRNLKRFISRHGIAKMFISDNAKCFMGPELTSFIHKIKN